MTEGISGWDDSRPGERLEIACEPNFGGIGTKSKFMDHLVPLVIDLPEVYRVVSSRFREMRTLCIRATEVEVPGFEGFH